MPQSTRLFVSIATLREDDTEVTLKRHLGGPRTIPLQSGQEPRFHEQVSRTGMTTMGGCMSRIGQIVPTSNTTENLEMTRFNNDFATDLRRGS